MNNKSEEIKHLFEQFGFEIRDESDDENYYRLKIENCFIFFDKNNDEIYTTFEVGVRPDFSANIISLISNNININKVFVANLYYDTEDETIFGDDAYKQFLKDMFDEVLNEYDKELYEIRLLEEAEPNTIQ